MPAEIRVAGPVPRYELPEWRERYGVVAGITVRGTTAEPFDQGLAGLKAPVGEVMERWRMFRAAVPGFTGVVISHQVHGATVLWHDSARGMIIEGVADGHATATPGVLLAVTVADCIPVYLVDPVRRAVALVHAGWRGTAAGVLSQGLALLQSHGSNVENVVIHCGIGICGQCYEVGSEVLRACGDRASAGESRGLDLRSVLKKQAGEHSVENVSTSHLCTVHGGPEFWSHRGSGGADGRMVAFLGFPLNQ
jgi:YfiH family protein